MKALRLLLHIPLRYRLLGVLGGLALLIAPWAYVMSQAFVFRHIEEQASTEMRADLMYLQRILLLLLRMEHLEHVQSAILSLDSTHEHELTLVTDAAGTIVAATRLDMLQTPWTAHSAEIDPALLGQFATGNPLAVGFSNTGLHLSGYMALCHPGEAPTLRPTQCGFVYTRHQIGARKAAATRGLQAQSLQHGVGGLVAALALWGLVQWTVTQRVERLIWVMQRFITGEQEARVGFTGQDELARLGQAFDRMAQTITESQQESAKQAQRLTALVQVAQRLTRGLTLPTVLQAIAEATAEVFGGEAAFRLLEEHWLVRMGATPAALASMVRERVALGESLSGKVAANGEAMITTDIAADSCIIPEHRQAAQPERLGALLCVPVTLEDRVLGTLHVYREQGYVFTQEDQTLATSLANQAAIAIDSARMFETLQAQTASLAQMNAVLEAEVQERRQAEVLLRERDVRMQAIVETALEGIITIDEQGMIDTYNAAAERLFGYTAAEVVGQNVRMLMPAPFRDEHDAYLERYLRTGERNIIGIGREVEGLRKDGTVFPLALAVSEMQVSGQRMFTGLVSDITMRRQAEETLRQANEALEQRVRERTAALEDANEEVKRFAYIVSHDLRAPLVNLKGFAGELRLAHQVLARALEQASPHFTPQQATEVQRTLTQDIPEALGFIEASVTRMDSLVRAILQLSRLGRRELTIEPLDTTALVQETLQTLAHQIAQRHVQVTVDPLPQVSADRIALAQIFGNLLTNAVHYLEPERPGSIHITAAPQPPGIAFQIRDNGRGMARSDIPRAFEPFRRVGRQDVPGEGMGLAYVRALVRRHGGEITCQSTLGAGTTFTFTIAQPLTGATPHV